MGEDTHLYVGHRWGADDIKAVIERTQATKVEVQSHHDIGIGYFDFTFSVGKNSRRMHVHTDASLPTGPATLLSLGANPQAVEIMRAIANCLGGILEPSDSSGDCQVIDGSFTDEDGLQYFLKYALVHDGVEHDDEQGFSESMAAWRKEMGC